MHPGKVLQREIETRNLSANALALKLRVPASRITEIIRGRRAITPETALRLGQCFDNDAQFWINLQTNYNLASARQRLATKIESEVERIT